MDTSTSKPEPKPSDDIFSSFFSAPQEPIEPKETPKPDLKTEEENFFKQPAPSEKEKSKLTKDSILALYSQSPSTNLANQMNPQPVSFPFGQQYQQQGFNSMPVQNGMQQQQFNQFQGMGSQFQQFGVQQPLQQQPMQQPMQGQSFPQNNQQFFQQQPNQQLSQQFGSLNLGQSFPAFQQNANVANSMWQ